MLAIFMFLGIYVIFSMIEHLGKFNCKSDFGLFHGYSKNSRAYRVYNMRTQTIIEFINVVVDDFNDFSEFSKE